MIASQQKSYAELATQPQLIRYFFSREDPFYTYLFMPDTRGLSNMELKSRMFLIVVANTLDDSIGVTCQKDLISVTGMFTRMTKELGIHLMSKTIFSTDLSKKAVNEAIDTWLQPSALDIVVFYYTGHGFRYANDASKYPRMSLRINGNGDIDQNNLLVEDVYNRIVKKGARVNIVLSDCCNENIGVPVPVGKLPLTTKDVGIAGRRLNIASCKALFFPNHPQTVLSCAAEANQRSVGNPAKGGFFTYYFLEELTKSLYGNGGEQRWLPILVNAKKNITYWATSGLCGSSRCVQRPEIKVIPEL